MPSFYQELSSIQPVNLSDIQIYSQLDALSAHLMTTQLQMFTIVGGVSPSSNIPVWIRLRLMVFCNLCNVIRVHVALDTTEAAQNVVLSESDITGRLLDRSKTMLFSSSGEDMTVYLEDVSIGWRCQGKFQTVAHSDIWKLNHSKSYVVRFLLEQIEPSQNGVSCNLTVHQSVETQYRILIKLVNEPTNTTSTSAIMTSPQFDTIDSNYSQTYLDPLETVFRLSTAVRQELWSLLDPYWKTLANHMNINGNLKYFEEQNSPADALLDLWEARCADDKDDDALSKLIRHLHAIGCHECANIIFTDILKQLNKVV